MVLTLLLCVLTFSTPGDSLNEVVQWRGPDRQAAFHASWLPADLGKAPNRLWQVPIGDGHASPLVAQNGKAYSFARVGTDEVVTCFDLNTGKPLWRQAYAVSFLENAYAMRHGKGPKATPILANGHLVTLGIGGITTCWDAESGKKRWQAKYFKPETISKDTFICAPCGKDCDKRTFEKAGPCPECNMALRPKNADTSGLFCGIASSPLVVNDLLITHVGNDRRGAVVARTLATGKVRWVHEGASPGYASPALFNLAQTSQIITYTKDAVIALDLDGKLMWSYPFKDEWNENIATPLQIGDLLFVSGPRHPLRALRVDKGAKGFQAKSVWQNEAVSFYMSSPVHFKGSLVGFSKMKKGQYVLIQPETGKTLWQSEGRMGHNAALWTVGDWLVSLDTDGNLKFFQPSADGLELKHTHSVANSQTWAHWAPLDKGRFLIKDKEHLSLWEFN